MKCLVLVVAVLISAVIARGAIAACTAKPAGLPTHAKCAQLDNTYDMWYWFTNTAYLKYSRKNRSTGSVYTANVANLVGQPDSWEAFDAVQIPASPTPYVMLSYRTGAGGYNLKTLMLKYGSTLMASPGVPGSVAIKDGSVDCRNVTTTIPPDNQTVTLGDRGKVVWTNVNNQSFQRIYALDGTVLQQ